MKLRTYQAFTMSEALDAVKRDLGADAVILHTRTFRRGGIFGFGSKQIVEVTATPADDVRPKHNGASSGGTATARPSRDVAARNTAARSYRQSQAMEAKPGATGDDAMAASHAQSSSEAGPTAQDHERTRRLAMALQQQLERRRQTATSPASTASSSSDTAATTPTTAPPTASQPAARSSTTAPATTARSASAAPAHAPSRAADADRSATDSSPTATLEPVEPRAEHRPAPVAQRYILARTVPESPRNGEQRNVLEVKTRPIEPDRPTRLNGSAAPPARPPDAPNAAERSPSSTLTQSSDDATNAVKEELATIRELVNDVLRRQTASTNGNRRPGESDASGAPSIPPKLFDMYLTLVAQDLAHDLADEIINDVRDALGPNERDDDAAVRDAVLRQLATRIPVADNAIAPDSPDDRPLTIALIGPTGVGKTTTVAKLAASLKLRHGKRVGLITSDTYRIAAVDQLRTYADIIDVPLKVVLTADEMRSAADDLKDCDVVLIDTAGRGQHDAERLRELERMLEAAQPHETHMVLSSTASEKVLLREYEAFSRGGADKVILTKLDEAVSFGTLVNVLRAIDRPLSYVTTGQEVPDDIEPARPDRLAALVLSGTLTAVAGDEPAHSAQTTAGAT